MALHIGRAAAQVGEAALPVARELASALGGQLLLVQAITPPEAIVTSEVKYAVAGYGKADKRQMQEMVRIILNLPHAPQPDDAADALAIALCHAQTAPFIARVEQGS